MTGPIQIASSVDPPATLQPRQLCITYPSGHTGAYYRLYIGSSTGNILLLDTTGGVSGVTGINSLTGPVSLLAGPGLAITTATPNITCGLLALSGSPAGTYAYPASINVDIYGRVTSLTPGSAPATTLPPSGPATGDLSGAYPGPTVAALRGIPISGTSPTNGQALIYNSSTAQYVPMAITSSTGGTVTTLSASVPSWETVVVTNPTTTPAVAITATSGLAANQFLATPNGAAGAVGLRLLVPADIPALSAYEPALGNPGTSGYVLSSTTGGTRSWIPNGTLTSVGLTVPSNTFTITGSPITTSGTLAMALANQSANLGFFGPTSGGAAAPTWRSIVDADLPSTAVTAGSYGGNGSAVTITVGSTGRLTAAATSYAPARYKVRLGTFRSIAVPGSGMFCSTATTMTTGDMILGADCNVTYSCSSSAGTVYLPPSSSVYDSTNGVGQRYTIYKTDTGGNTLTLSAQGSDAIQHAGTSGAVIALSSAGSITVQAISGGWIAVQ